MSKSSIEPKADLQPLLDRITSRDYTVGIVGMGYVGLPLALASIKAGFRVVGFDIDEVRVDLLNHGDGGFAHIPNDLLGVAVRNGSFRATSDLSGLNQPDAILIAVPTPLSKQREPDLSFVENSARALGKVLRPGQLVVLESTTWPGTTKEVMQPILERSGMRTGLDYFLAFSPEREDPGNTFFQTENIPKVVGADDSSSLKLACALYDKLIKKPVPVTSSATAEAVKLTENIFRSVNIALVNELKVIFDCMGIDVWEVIEAAKTKPFGYMPFFPGPGLGGHCIPIDPFYLTWKAREFELTTRFIELAGEINSKMPNYVVSKLAEELNCRSRRALNGARVLIIGLAYKKNIEDTRESPAFKLIELVERQGALADFYDPYIATIPRTREYGHLQGRKCVSLTSESLSSYDAVVIATDHDSIDWSAVGKYSRLVIDTRNVCARNGFVGPNIIKA